MLKYKVIYDLFKESIYNKNLPVGAKLPSIREIALLHQVSVITVQQALTCLEDDGFIVGKARKGYFVQSVNRGSDVLKEGPDSACTLRQRIMEEIYSALNTPFCTVFAFGYLHHDYFPLRGIRREISRINRQNSVCLNTISFPPGSYQLRQEICKHMMQWGCFCSPDDIVLTNGAHMALLLTLQVISKPDDIILIDSPTFFLIIPLLHSLNLRYRVLPPRNAGDYWTELSKALMADEHPVAYICCTMGNNPDGQCFNDKEKQRLVELLAFHSVFLIEDVAGGDLNYQTVCTAAKHFDTTDNVIVCGSFNKMLSPGIRLGWVANRVIAPPIIMQCQQKGLLNPVMTELAVANFLSKGGVRRHLRWMKSTLKRNVAIIRDHILSCFPLGTKVVLPESGYSLWVQLPAGIYGIDLYMRCKSVNIFIAPGLLFCDDHRYDDFIRINAVELPSKDLFGRISLVGEEACALFNKVI